MIFMTKQAADEIRQRYVKGDEETVWLRVATTGSRCGSYLTLKPDQRQARDEVLASDGFSIVAEPLLLHSLGGVQIGYDASHWGGGNLTVKPLVSLETGSCGDCRC